MKMRITLLVALLSTIDSIYKFNQQFSAILIYVHNILLSNLVGSLISPDEGEIGRILGGTPVAVGEHPYVVAIYIDAKFRCSGFIYSERWVVTSASCLRG